MLKVQADQSIIDIVQLLLAHSDRTLCFFDTDLQVEHKLNRSHLMDLFAAGFPGEYDVKHMTAASPLLLSELSPDANHQALEYSLRWFISIFDSLHDGVLIADRNEIVRYINKSFERISGARFSDVVGQVLTKARPGARLPEVIRSGKPMFGVRRKFGGIEYMTDMHPLIINGRCMGGVTIARDITEIQQLQTKLSKYRARYNDLLRQISKETATYTFADILGNSSSLQIAKRLAEKLASSTLPVMLRGESGTGKELFAHAIHLASPRRDQAFITVNCAAIPGPLLESELFGYREGAFSGAKQGGKTGLITLAHNGTLFLDEIGDMDIELQAKMLRVLQTNEVQPIGSLTKEKVDIRVIAATNAHLEKMIVNGKFREDLFYRLNVSQVNMPPLRERVEDITPMAKQFLANCIHPVLGRLELSGKTLAILEQYSWPGNVRELQNTIRFIANITDRQVITPKYLPQVFFQQKSAAEPRPANQQEQSARQHFVTLKENKSASEKQAILAALDTFGRSVRGKREAARHLGISLTTLYTRINYHNIK